MASKKVALLILWIGQTFLWTGSAYYSILFRLYDLYAPAQAVLVTEGLFYAAQAVGIAIFAALVRRKPVFASGNACALAAVTLTGVCTLCALMAGGRALTVVLGAFMNLFIGVLSGLSLTRLTSSVPQQLRGRAFGFAYAIGSVGTFLLTLPCGGEFLRMKASIYALIALIVLSVALTRRLEPINFGGEARMADSPRADKKLLPLALSVALMCSLTHATGAYLPAADVSGILGATFTRAFYALGLIAAGFINDKNRRYGAIGCLASLIFPFARLALRGEVGVSAVLDAFSYVFYAFLSVYRVVLFSDLAGKRAAFLPLAAFGLMIGRLGDAVGTLIGVTFGGSQRLITALTLAAFIVDILVFFAIYQKLYTPRRSEKQNEEALLSDFEARYQLTRRQREIFRLVLKGCTNAEIASELFLAQSTVKFHMKNILKATECANRTELIAAFKSMCSG